MSLLYRQPFKGLYLTSSLLVTLCVRLPFWVTIALLPATRPRRAWTVKRCVYVRLFTYFMSLLSKVGRISKIPDYLDLIQGLDVDGVWIDPIPARLLGGEIKDFASKANVKAVRIPGYWVHKPGETIDPKAVPQPGEKVVYALHGGAYVVGSASPNDPTSNIAKGLLQYAGKNGIRRVFSAEYRLAHPPPGEPAAPFPAALLDAIAGYAYLVQVAGFSPENIIVEGDSAGGNLALALVRYLVEEQVFLASAAKDEKEKTLSPPGGILLMSPWSDLGSSHDKDPAPYLRQTDYVGNAPKGTAKGAQTLFAGTHGLASLDTNRWISPASLHLGENEVSFVGWPRTFLACGGVEYLAPQIKVLRDRMIKDMGAGAGTGQLLYHEAPEAIHDWCTMPWCEPERSKTLQAISDWIERK